MMKSMSNLKAGRGGGVHSAEGLPDCLISEIVQKLDLGSLCSTACVSRNFHSCVSHVLSTRSSLDLSAFSPDAETLSHILNRFERVDSVTVDCLHLENSAVVSILGTHVQELNLLKGSLLSSSILTSIGRSCPNLRILTLELVGEQASEVFKKNLVEMLKCLIHLESLSIKMRGTDFDAYDLIFTQLFLPSSIKFLKLQPVGERGAIHLLQQVSRDNISLSETLSSLSIPSLYQPRFVLQHLSLVLDVISDELIICIVNALPLLVELNLEDRPLKEPLMPHDLSNNGIQSLRACEHLTALSVIRSRVSYPASFKWINDLGMFLLSENCRGLESISLGGFSTVTDAGFSAILNSCQSLKRFEIRNVPLLSDLTFHNMSNAADSLVELRLLSCSIITSETIEQLASCAGLEVLDVSGCRSLADACISHLMCFSKLTALNLGGADVTDSGLAVLGNGRSPIARLCLRGSKRITDKGISLLLLSGGTISKTLASLDIGHMPGISDKAICTIASSATEITELCIRYCFFVTDASARILASRRWSQDRTTFLQRLDLFHCPRVSVELVGFLQKPSFPNLRWLGVGLTSSATQRDAFALIRRERPWLTICFDGCEIGCRDGWHFHHSDGA